MILRCTVPRKKEPDRPCDGFVTAIPMWDTRILRRIRYISEATSGNQVCGCIACGVLYQLEEPVRFLNAS
jgi:hypothetical protein